VNVKPNADLKTQLIWIGTRQQLAKINSNSTQTDQFAGLLSSLKHGHWSWRGARWSAVSVSAGACCLPYSCSYQIRQLKSVKRGYRRSLNSLIQYFIHYRLDYCNSTLAGVAKVYLQKLQTVQNMAAHIVTGARRCECDRITPILEHLHWLPVSQRVVVKRALMVW